MTIVRYTCKQARQQTEQSSGQEALCFELINFKQRLFCCDDNCCCVCNGTLPLRRKPVRLERARNFAFTQRGMCRVIARKSESHVLSLLSWSIIQQANIFVVCCFGWCMPVPTAGPHIFFSCAHVGETTYICMQQQRVEMLLHVLPVV